MKILLTNHQLRNFGGTENFTLDIAKGLKRAGHQVVVYSKFIDKLKPFFERDEIECISDLSLIANRSFDIAHVHHNISAMEVRFAFPNLPIFFLSHGSIEFLEKPPAIDLNIALHGGVSEYLVNKLKKSVKGEVVLFSNVFDEKRFSPKRRINTSPKRALVLSAKLDERKETIIRKACQKMGIKLELVGGRFGEVAYYGIPNYINKSDVVFTIGRGVVETMLCGRIPIVFDTSGGDGILNEENFMKLSRKNFNGKVSSKNYTVKQLIGELKKYDSEQGDKLRQLALEHFSTHSQIPRLMKIYEKAITLHNKRGKTDNESLGVFINTIKATYYNSLMTKKGRDETYLEYKLKLDEITSSKFYKLWPFYTKLKDLIR